MECQCKSCRGACQFKPGWFMPGEVEKAAMLLGVPLPEFFKTRLGIDWFTNPDGPPTFVLSPAVTHQAPGQEFGYDARGVCTFFKEGKCEIHAAKPSECRALMHTDTWDMVPPRHAAVAVAWEGSQSQIVSLLGREPEDTAPSNFLEMLLL